MPPLTKAGAYFAGFSLRSSIGLSSDDVVVYKVLTQRPELRENFGIVFLPTVAERRVSSHRKLRIHLVYYRSQAEYLILTRPLSITLEEVVSLAQKLRGNSTALKIFASLASERLSGFEQLIREFSSFVDGYEVDLGLMFHLYGMRRSFESFALDLLEELVRRADRPLLAKVSPNVPMSDDFLTLVVETGISGLVFSPHVTYSVGNELFQAHSPLLSRVYSYAWARLSASLNLPAAYITDMPPSMLEEADPARAFDALLLDTAALLSHVKIREEAGAPMPLRWVETAEGAYPTLEWEDRECALVCPFAAFSSFSSIGQGGLLTADEEKCDLCGLCLSACRSAKLARVLTPE